MAGDISEFDILISGKMEGMSEDYREILERMISFPLRSQIKIDFDFSKKNFILSIPIYTSHGLLPSSVKEYVEARKNHRFKPHETTFQFENSSRVKLVQELPFEFGFQPGLREQIVSFWKLAKHCHRILIELVVEEKYRTALNLDPDFGT